MVLSYYTYFTLGFTWALFFRRFYSPLFFLLTVFHELFYLLVFGRGTISTAEYFVDIPLTVYFGVQLGYLLKLKLNSRALIFVNHIRSHSWWLAFAVVEFIIIHIVFVVWEDVGRPWNFIATLIIQVFGIPILYFINRWSKIWVYIGVDGKEHKDARAAEVFHLNWFVFQVTTTLVFGIVQSVAPNFWQFWTSLILFLVFLVLIFLIGLLSDHMQWKFKTLVRCPDTGMMMTPQACCTPSSAPDDDSTGEERKTKPGNVFTAAYGLLPRLDHQQE